MFVRPPLLWKRLTSQVIDLQRRLAEVRISTSPPRRLMMPNAKDGGMQIQGGVIYAVDPDLEVEVGRLREVLADRERVIEDLRQRHGVRHCCTGEN